MENKKEFLTEEHYENGKKLISKIAKIVLVLGLILGGTLIVIGVIKIHKSNSEYSNDNISQLQEKLDKEKSYLEDKKAELQEAKEKELSEEKQKLEAKKQELIDKGIKYSTFAKYDEGESYDLKLVTNVLDPSFAYCSFDEYKSNDLTSKYCLLKENKDDNSKNIKVIESAIDPDFNHCLFDEYKNNNLTSKYCSLKGEIEDKKSPIGNIDSFESAPLFMLGGFVIFATLIVSGSLYMFAKRREIFAFQAQQIMPVAQEGMEKMAPTIGNVASTIGEKIAPTYGKMAKEISKGIKEGLKDEDTETKSKPKK